MTITPAEHAALQEALAKATPGPWKLILHGNESYPFPLSIHTEDDAFWVARGGEVSSLANAELIALARNHLPGILAELEALKADRDRWEDANGELSLLLIEIRADRDRLLAENARLKEGHETALFKLEPLRIANTIGRDAYDYIRALLTELEGAKT